MRPRSGPPGPRRRGSAALLRLLLAVSAWLYSALLVLYPEAFRRRYEAEMRRDFQELLREGLQEGGTKELVRVSAQAHSDLVLTALKERGTTSARRYAAYLSVDPRIATRAAARAMVAVVLVAVGVLAAGFLQTPTYETSAHVWVGWEQEGPGQTLEYRELPAPMIMRAIGSRGFAKEAIQRLGLQMGAAELLNNLTVEQVEGTQFIRLTYEDADPERAKLVVNTVGEVSSEFISERSSTFTATVWEKATAPENPVSPTPLRNGLLALVIGLGLCAGTALALPGLGARVAGTLGERPTRQEVGIVERVKEKKLLRALGRRGKLTAVEAALETGLSVDEADRIFEELAARGYLEVTVEHGRLYYALWDRDAPP